MVKTPRRFVIKLFDQLILSLSKKIFWHLKLRWYFPILKYISNLYFWVITVNRRNFNKVNIGVLTDKSHKSIYDILSEFIRNCIATVIWQELNEPCRTQGFSCKNFLGKLYLLPCRNYYVSIIIITVSISNNNIFVVIRISCHMRPICLSGS